MQKGSCVLSRDAEEINECSPVPNSFKSHRFSTFVSGSPTGPKSQSKAIFMAAPNRGLPVLAGGWARLVLQHLGSGTLSWWYAEMLALIPFLQRRITFLPLASYEFFGLFQKGGLIVARLAPCCFLSPDWIAKSQSLGLLPPNHLFFLVFLQPSRALSGYKVLTDTRSQSVWFAVLLALSCLMIVENVCHYMDLFSFPQVRNNLILGV